MVYVASFVLSLLLSALPMAHSMFAPVLPLKPGMPLLLGALFATASRSMSVVLLVVSRPLLVTLLSPVLVSASPLPVI